VKDGVLHDCRLAICLKQDITDKEGTEDDADIAELGKGRSLYIHTGAMLPKLFAAVGNSVNSFLGLANELLSQ
jgi:hypothetical protein